MYQAVMYQGRWHVLGPDGHYSKLGYTSRRVAERLARQLDDARAMYFQLYDDEVVRL